MENDDNVFLLKPNLSFWEEVFSSFILLKIFNDYFAKMEKEPNNKIYPLSNIFYNLFHKNIKKSNCPIEFQKIIISKNKENLIENSSQLFNFLLEELHNELKDFDNKTIKNNIIQEKNDLEIKEINAYKIFKSKRQNDTSFIQNLFFGVKKIIKTCQSCGNETYKFEYFKFCPFDIQKIEGMVHIKDLYENIQREFYSSEYNCQICQQNKLRIKIEIYEEPEILILFFYNYKNGLIIDFNNKFLKNYIIESFIMGNYERKCIFDCLLCCRNFGDNNKKFVAYLRKNKNSLSTGNDSNSIENYEDSIKTKYNNNEYYKIGIEENIKVNKKELDKGNPYIIFYSKIKRKKKEKNKEEKETYENSNEGDESKEPFRKNKEINNENYYSYNEIEDKNISKSDNNDKKKIFKSCFSNLKQKVKSIVIIPNESIKNNIDKIENESIKRSINNKSLLLSNNASIADEEGLIRLYFMFNDGNIIFIDVENSTTFEEIVKELKNQNEWISINIDNLYFNDIKINKNQKPENLGINHGDYIDVKSSLINKV